MRGGGSGLCLKKVEKETEIFFDYRLRTWICWEPVRNSAHDKGHEEGGSAYAKAGSRRFIIVILVIQYMYYIKVLQ